MGIPVSLLGKNYDALNLLRAMTAAISLTSWLAPRLRRKLKHKVLQSHLQILHSMILIIYLLAPFTMTRSIHLFQGFRIIQTRMIDGACRNPWASTQSEAEVNFGRVYRSYILVGINTSYPQPLFKTIFPFSKRLSSFYPHHQHATQVLHWLGNKSHP